MQQKSYDVIAIQHPTNKDYNFSATYNALLVMENDGDIESYLNGKRRIDGTVSAHQVAEAYSKFKIQIEDWAVGEPDFEIMSNSFNEEREGTKLTDTVSNCLKNLRYDGNSVVIGSQLNRKDYMLVNEVLELLGGKWNKKAKAHVFDEVDPEDAVANYLLTGKLERKVKNNFGYFPTPKELGSILVDSLNLNESSLLLEPESGTGNLALLAAEKMPIANITCFEIQEKNCVILRNHGFNVSQVDFLTIDPNPIYTAVLMNPPFEKQQDIDHVLHAFKFLRPGGELRAIMSASVSFRSNRKTVEFRAWLDSLGAVIEENDSGAFKESGTNVSTIRVSISKPIHHIIESNQYDTMSLIPLTAVQNPAVLLADVRTRSLSKTKLVREEQQVAFEF